MPDPFVYTANARLKGNPPGWEKWFAWYAGIGVGHSEPADFFSLDAGFTLGCENAYPIPYLGVDGTLGMPLASRAVNVTDPEDEDGPKAETAPETAGLIAYAGVRLPLSSGNIPLRQRPALVVETHLAPFWTPYFRTGFMGARAALEFPFGY